MKTSDLPDPLQQLARCFLPTEGNSNKQKLALYVTLVIVLGVMFDFVQINTAPKEYVWEAIKVGLGGLGAHIWNKERELLAGDGDPDDD